MHVTHYPKIVLIFIATAKILKFFSPDTKLIILNLTVFLVYYFFDCNYEHFTRGFICRTQIQTLFTLL